MVSSILSKNERKKFDFTKYYGKYRLEVSPSDSSVPQDELFSFVFWENRRHQKDISKLTDLYYDTFSKFLTMSTEFDKNFSKWSYYSTDHKNYIKNFFEHFPSKIIFKNEVIKK